MKSMGSYDGMGQMSKGNLANSTRMELLKICYSLTLSQMKVYVSKALITQSAVNYIHKLFEYSSNNTKS